MEIPELLNCFDRRHFWITWKYGAIEVGRGQVVGLNKFIDAQFLEMYHIKAIGYSTGYGYNGTWYIPVSDDMIQTVPPSTEDPDTGHDEDVSSGLTSDQVAGIIMGCVLGTVLLVGIGIIVIGRYRFNVTPNLPLQRQDETAIVPNIVTDELEQDAEEE